VFRYRNEYMGVCLGTTINLRGHLRLVCLLDYCWTSLRAAISYGMPDLEDVVTLSAEIIALRKQREEITKRLEQKKAQLAALIGELQYWNDDADGEQESDPQSGHPPSNISLAELLGPKDNGVPTTGPTGPSSWTPENHGPEPEPNHLNQTERKSITGAAAAVGMLFGAAVAESFGSTVKERVFSLIDKSEKEWTTNEIASALSIKNHQTISSTVSRLAKEGRIDKVDKQHACKKGLMDFFR
jgi:hypothetical protein